MQSLILQAIFELFAAAYPHRLPRRGGPVSPAVGPVPFLVFAAVGFLRAPRRGAQRGATRRPLSHPQALEAGPLCGSSVSPAVAGILTGHRNGHISIE